MVERRQFARIKINLSLKFKSFSSKNGCLSGSASDLSRGGVFLRTTDVKPVGTRLEMELPIPGGQPVTLTGTVRSIRYFHNEPAGMGIEFNLLSAEDRNLIDLLWQASAAKRGGGTTA